MGSYILFTAPRHPKSNGLAENFVKTLKSAIFCKSPSSLDELDLTVDNFLMQFRNADHTSSCKTPTKLFKGRDLKTYLHFQTSEVYFKVGNSLAMTKRIVISLIENKMFEVLDLDTGKSHRRHLEQIKFASHKNETELNK